MSETPTNESPPAPSPEGEGRTRAARLGTSIKLLVAAAGVLAAVAGVLGALLDPIAHFVSKERELGLQRDMADRDFRTKQETQRLQAERQKLTQEVNQLKNVHDELRASAQLARENAREAREELDKAQRKIAQLEAGCREAVSVPSLNLARAPTRSAAALAAMRCPRERIHVSVIAAGKNEVATLEACARARGNVVGANWDVDSGGQCNCLHN
jgi:hypothetical protein